MKKIVYISFVFAFILAFTSCEKEDIFPVNHSEKENGVCGNSGTRGGDTGGVLTGVTDPDEDEDFDEEDDDESVVDPDEDEDFDEEDEKGATKPGSESPGK